MTQKLTAARWTSSAICGGLPDIWRFGVMEGKEFTLSNLLFTLLALDNVLFFTI